MSYVKVQFFLRFDLIIVLTVANNPFCYNYS